MISAIFLGLLASLFSIVVNSGSTAQAASYLCIDKDEMTREHIKNVTVATPWNIVFYFLFGVAVGASFFANAYSKPLVITLISVLLFAPMVISTVDLLRAAKRSE